jgi:hypothetical protein
MIGKVFIKKWLAFASRLREIHRNYCLENLLERLRFSIVDHTLSEHMISPDGAPTDWGEGLGPEMTKLLRLVIPVVIAVVLGPLIAGLAIGVFAVAVSIFDSANALPIKELLPMFGVYIASAYLLGGAIALLAGILVSIWTVWRQPSVVVVIAAAIIATSGYMAVGALGLLGPVELTNARSNFFLTLALAVIAAAGCWLVVRPFANAP